MSVTISRTGKAILKYGGGGRSSFSGHSANPDSPSGFYASKARAEEAARDIFPETTIVRPAPMFGYEDRLLNRYATAANVFTVNHLREKSYPTHAIDVGRALEKMMLDDATAAQTYELYGPDLLTQKDLVNLISKTTRRSYRHINLPRPVVMAISTVLDKAIWWPTISPDEVKRQFIDQTIDKSAKTYLDLGMKPGAVKDFVNHYMLPYRSSSFYDQPPSTEQEKEELKKQIHIIE